MKMLLEPFSAREQPCKLATQNKGGVFNVSMHGFDVSSFDDALAKFVFPWVTPWHENLRIRNGVQPSQQIIGGDLSQLCSEGDVNAKADLVFVNKTIYTV